MVKQTQTRPQKDQSKGIARDHKRISKSRKSNSKLSYCQRLAKDLEQADLGCKNACMHKRSAFEPHPGKLRRTKPSYYDTSSREGPEEDVGEPLPLPGFLRLPPELRQQILYDVFEDDELSHLFVSEMQVEIIRKLAGVCTVFKKDMNHVVSSWHKRKEYLRQQRARQVGSFDAYIADMMASIRASSRVLSTIERHRRRRETSNTKMDSTNGKAARKLRLEKAGRLLKRIEWKGKADVFR